MAMDGPAMTPGTAPGTMDRDSVLRAELSVVRDRHRALDDQITALQDAPLPDQLTIRRLKKEKLALKDRIARIEDQLTPDIIA
ncbi:MAG: YdcH family protein [Pseudomonadota bacterium]